MTAEALWKFILSLSVVFPAIVGLIRFRKTNPSYRPFLIYIFASLLSELVIGFIISHYNKKAEILSWHLFNLFEAIVLLLQFYFWKRFERHKKIFPIIIAMIAGGWLFENFVASTIYEFNVVYLIAYSFVLVLLSVQTINYIIVNEGRQPLIKNAMFIICTAIIVFFIYDIFVYTLLVKGIDINNKKLVNQVFAIRVNVNAFTNLLYGLAIFFIPRKKTDKDLFMDLSIEEKDFKNEEF